MNTWANTFQWDRMLDWRPEEVVHAPAMARGARCTECAFYGQNRGPVHGTILPDSPLIIVGEGPGDDEVEQGRHFVGWSGGILDAALAAGGLPRTACSITNATLCQPPYDGKRTVSYTEVVQTLRDDWRARCKVAKARGEKLPPEPLYPHVACAPRLARDLAESSAKTVLAVGKAALEASARELGIAQTGARIEGQPHVASLKRQHGAPVVAPDGRVLMSAYHPAMAHPRRGKCEWMPVIQENIARTAWLARQGGQLPWREVPAHLNSSAEEIWIFCQRLMAADAEVTVDIETTSLDIYTTHIRCIGLGAVLDGQLEIMVVPLRHMDGAQWWPEHIAQMLGFALREVLNRLRLIFHHGIFDTGVLVERGLLTNLTKTWFDTAVAHHNTPDNDLEHSLGFVFRRFHIGVMWKSDVDHKSVNNVDEPVLHRYCGKDIQATFAIAEPLRKQIAYWGTEPQQETDTRMLPTLRDMGRTGLCLSEGKRGEFSEVLNWQCQRTLYELRELVGDDQFNPRSVPKLQDLIFGKWRIKPVLNADGFEIVEPDGGSFSVDWQAALLQEADDDLRESAESEEELEEFGSTSSAAILALKSQRELTPNQHSVLDTILTYRAYDKLRGTYIDNLKTREIDWAAHGLDVGRAAAVGAYRWDNEKRAFGWEKILSERCAYSFVHSVFRNHIVPTGRLASSGPNVQNWSASGRVNTRKMVVAPPGHVLVGADYEQLEGRIYAVDAQDQILLQTIAEGKDLHSMNAASILAKSANEIMDWYEKVEHGNKEYRKHWRTIAKRFAFLEIYGGKVGMLFSVMAAQRNKLTGALDFPNLTRADVDVWHERWHAFHPETQRWHAQCHAFYLQYGYAQVPLLDQRKRFFLGGVSRENAIPNMRIQGLASSLANKAVLGIAARIPFQCWSFFTGLNLQVHDYIQVVCPKDRARETEQIIEEEMNFEWRGVMMRAKAETRECWAEMS